MLNVISVIVTAFQFLILFVVLGAFTFVPVICLYLMSEGFRDVVYDFECWAERRRIRRSWKKHTDQYGSMDIVSYAQFDAELTMGLYNHKMQNKTIYDEVAAYHMIDPLGQELKDITILDTATEFHNADPRK